MSTRLEGRTTAVPHRLLVPAPDASIRLRIAEYRLMEAAGRAAPSNTKSTTRAVLAERDPALIRQSYGDLLDELSVHVRATARADSERMLARTLTELDAVVHIERGGIGQALTDCDAFIELLCRVHRAVRGGATSFRKTPVFIRPDDVGNVIAFPPWQLCEALIRSLARFIAEHAERYPGLCAVVAYAGIIHAHPFRDANGRTARVFFNLIQRHTSGSRHFLPLSKLAQFAEGGFLIKLRRALYGGEWEPLAAFFADAVRLSEALQNENGSLKLLSIQGGRE